MAPVLTNLMTSYTGMAKPASFSPFELLSFSPRLSAVIREDEALVRRTAEGMHYCSSSPVSLFAKETVLETKYHTSMYMGRTVMRSEPWVGWGRREKDVLLGVVPPEHGRSPTAWRDLDVTAWHLFPERTSPKCGIPAYAKCSGKESRSLWSSQNMNQAIQRHVGALARFLQSSFTAGEMASL